MTWAFSSSLSLLCILFIAVPPSSADQKMCTKRVEGVTTKVPQTRRIPAKCSNWDRAWTWVTRDDCGTKYQITYIELHQQHQYKLVYECCPGDTDCKTDGQSHHESDERFLAITFGCASAAFIIIIIIIVVSVCRKKNAGFIFCPYKKEYENAEGCHGERSDPNDYVIGDFGEERKLVLESEYEEICDITPAIKGGTWDNIYQKTPTAPPEEMLKEWREPAQCGVLGNGEISEPGSSNEGNLVEIDTTKPAKVTGQTHLFDTEENHESDSIKIKDTAFGAESGDVLSDDLTQEVFDSNLPTDKTSSIELLQPLKAEDQNKSCEIRISENMPDSAKISASDLMTSPMSDDTLSEKEIARSAGKDQASLTSNSLFQNGVYEELQ